MTYECFGDYWEAVDAAMIELYGRDTMSIREVDVDQIADAEEDGWSPEDVAKHFGKLYNLPRI